MDEDLENDAVYCPMCGGPAPLLGTLGMKDWFRCRNCGWEFAVDAEPEPAPEN